MLNELKKILFVLFFGILFLVNDIHAQTSAYHSVVFPYEPPATIVTTGGVLTPFSDTQVNPALLSGIKQSFATVNFVVTQNIQIFNYNYYGSNRKPSGLINTPAQFSVYVPFPFNEKSIVIGFSGRSVPYPEFEIPGKMQWDELTRIEHNRTGNVWNANLALGTNLIKGLGIGINVSRWFGSWKWNDSINFENFGSGTFKYSGTNLSLGALYQFSRFKIGLTLHSPFTLMTGRDIEIQSWYINTQIRNIEQKFDGAGRLGITYALNPATQFEIAYRLQGKIYVKNYFPEQTFSSYDQTFGMSHQFSALAILEYKRRSVKVPFFAAYQITGMPAAQSSDLRDYQQITASEKNNLRHSFSLGMNVIYHSVGFHFAGRWNHNKIRVTNNSTPPYS